MGKYQDYEIEVQKEIKELRRVTKVQASNYLEAGRKAGFVIRRVGSKLGRPRKD